MTLSRRRFLIGAAGVVAAATTPALWLPDDRRYWALDQSMLRGESWETGKVPSLMDFERALQESYREWMQDPRQESRLAALSIMGHQGYVAMVQLDGAVWYPDPSLDPAPELGDLERVEYLAPVASPGQERSITRQASPQRGLIHLLHNDRKT